MRLNTIQPDLEQQIRTAILAKIPDAKVDVSGQGGHFNLVVTSTEFAGKTPLQKQRLVYGAITQLMAGSNAPVHAIDSLKTLEP